jgi:transcriptional regulator with XRE-family HTH domain
MLHLTPKQLKDRLKEVMKSRKISFPELEKQTNIPANRMYKWYQQGTNPKKEDSDILEKWLNDLENVPIIQEPAIEYGIKTSLERSIENLTENELRTTAVIERLMDMLEEERKEKGQHCHHRVRHIRRH